MKKWSTSKVLVYLVDKHFWFSFFSIPDSAGISSIVALTDNAGTGFIILFFWGKLSFFSNKVIILLRTKIVCLWKRLFYILIIITMNIGNYNEYIYEINIILTFTIIFTMILLLLRRSVLSYLRTFMTNFTWKPSGLEYNASSYQLLKIFICWLYFFAPL